ncbi:MAG TPA: hypothetical protein PK867_05780 [Pirellulales bacterium]|nr:hypothetical protein [Pirellulales bacterium]
MTVRIRRKLDSETLYLPELRPLIGKNVEIIVLEEPLAAATPGSDDWEAAIKAVQELEDCDFEVLQKTRGDDVQQDMVSAALPQDVPLEEFDRLLDELSSGPALPHLPADFSRADIYADHD